MAITDNNKCADQGFMCTGQSQCNKYRWQDPFAYKDDNQKVITVNLHKAAKLYIFFYIY